MSESEAYSEQLPCGGNLRVTKDYSTVSYYFPGPDARYNGTFFHIDGKDIQEYILAIKENWKTLNSLAKIAPAGGTFSKEGKMKMSIVVGGHFRGFHINGYSRLAVVTESDVEKYVSSYEYALKRANEIQLFLSGLDGAN